MCSAQLFNRAEDRKVYVSRYILLSHQHETNVSSQIKLSSFPAISFAFSFSHLSFPSSIYFTWVPPRTSCDRKMVAAGLDFGTFLGSSPWKRMRGAFSESYWCWMGDVPILELISNYKAWGMWCSDWLRPNHMPYFWIREPHSELMGQEWRGDDPCSRQFLRWLPVIPASWYLHLCIFLSPWAGLGLVTHFSSVEYSKLMGCHFCDQVTSVTPVLLSDSVAFWACAF